MTVHVAVFGAGGRMGRTICQAVIDDPELELVGAVDPAHAGAEVLTSAGSPLPDVLVDAGPDALMERGVQVVVDFTRIEAARQNLAWAADAGVHAVVGTTGFTEDDFATLRESFRSSNCLVAPNFAIGAVLLMRMAELAAPWFETAEVIELHHDRKVDAPSGTALRTVERMAAASDEWAADPTESQTLAGTRGGEGPAGIHVHSVRLQGLVAHQEVLLGTVGQTLTIRHDSYDRTSFMPGVLLAVKYVADHPGLTLGLDPLLGI
jgi:4-hydroxy-tetrahydrodipicolinate reductase